VLATSRVRAFDIARACGAPARNKQDESNPAPWLATSRVRAFDIARACGAPARNKQDEPTLAPWRSHKQGLAIGECEGEDSNLHGSYPASTSRDRLGSAPEAAFATTPLDLSPLEMLRGEAESLLACAAERSPAELARLQSFARACLELTEAGRLALAVLDGGLFAPRRALELAEHVVKETESLGASDPRADGDAQARTASRSSRRRIE
jgi:hypothetical protein